MYTARRTIVATSMAAVMAVAGVTAAIAADPAPAPPPKIAFLANGIVPADALAAGPIAGQLGAPVFTTHQDALPAGTAAALDDYDPELVIVMGGPVAIAESVVNHVAAATGLPVVDPSPTPTGGIVRAAGGDRFETATIVADLLAAYAPAYLPVDLQAVDADLLDGKDSTDFALSDQACPGGQVQSGVAADGTPACVDDGGGEHSIVGKNGRLGYVWASQEGAASYTPSSQYSYNSSGGPITVTRSATGRYAVKFEGLDLSGGHIQVTRYSGNGYCNSQGWAGDTASVGCWDETGAPEDTEFDLMFVD